MLQFGSLKIRCRQAIRDLHFKTFVSEKILPSSIWRWIDIAFDLIAYVSYVVIDGNIITGQNPASSEETAKKMMSLVHHGEAPTVYYNLSLVK